MSSSPSSSSTILTPTSLKINSTTLNETLYYLLSKLYNRTELYKHQSADLIEPEKYPVAHIHIIIWVLIVITYLIAIPLAIRIVQSRKYLNIIDYFSFHIVLGAFIAWIPALLLIIYHWSQFFTLRLCRLHYVILATNETVPFFFILYMIIDRFLYAHPQLNKN